MIIFLLITIFIGGVITAPIINGDATSDLIEEPRVSAVQSVISDFKKNCNVLIITNESCGYPLRRGSRTRKSCSVKMTYDSRYQYHCDSDITAAETYNNNYCDKDGVNTTKKIENEKINCTCHFTNIMEHHVCVLIEYTKLHIRDENIAARVLEKKTVYS